MITKPIFLNSQGLAANIQALILTFRMPPSAEPFLTYALSLHNKPFTRMPLPELIAKHPMSYTTACDILKRLLYHGICAHGPFPDTYIFDPSLYTDQFFIAITPTPFENKPKKSLPHKSIKLSYKGKRAKGRYGRNISNA